MNADAHKEKNCFSGNSCSKGVVIFLIQGTRAEDNFAQLEKISYPILNIEIVSYPTIFQQNILVPHPEVSVKKIDLWKDTQLPQAIFIPLK